MCENVRVVMKYAFSSLNVNKIIIIHFEIIVLSRNISLK